MYKHTMGASVTFRQHGDCTEIAGEKVVRERYQEREKESKRVNKRENR